MSVMMSVLLTGTAGLGLASLMLILGLKEMRDAAGNGLADEAGSDELAGGAPGLPEGM